MKALIAIHQQSVNNQPLPTVSARELHTFLEVGRDFSTWIKDRIEEFGYESGRDFLAITGSPISGSGEFNPCPPKEYHLTLDMAKELAMIERSPMGRVARKYFIKCEQLAREAVPLLLETVFKCKPEWGFNGAGAGWPRKTALAALWGFRKIVLQWGRGRMAPENGFTQFRKPRSKAGFNGAGAGWPRKTT